MAGPVAIGWSCPGERYSVPDGQEQTGVALCTVVNTSGNGIFILHVSTLFLFLNLILLLPVLIVCFGSY